MPGIELSTSFLERSKTLQSRDELALLLEEVTLALGFSYFALVHHTDLRQAGQQSIQIHNYPNSWATRFIEDGMHAEDPVHQACLRSNVGFAWSELSSLIPLTRRQRTILDDASRHGLKFGFTTPANVPGEYGSCSFASDRELQPSGETLMLAQMIGGFAYQAARRLQAIDSTDHRVAPRLTRRQHDCLLFAIRGKTDWEISRILGLSEETVSQHLSMARARYGVVKRLQLAAHAILDGEVNLIEALSTQVPLKRE